MIWRKQSSGPVPTEARTRFTNWYVESSKRESINYAQAEEHFGYLSKPFIFDLACRKFNLSPDELIAKVGRYSRGKYKGLSKGKLLWWKIVKGGWVKTGPYDWESQRAQGHVIQPGATFGYHVVDFNGDVLVGTMVMDWKDALLSTSTPAPASSTAPVSRTYHDVLDADEVHHFRDLIRFYNVHDIPGLETTLEDLKSFTVDYLNTPEDQRPPRFEDNLKLFQECNQIQQRIIDKLRINGITEF